jgi:hypothetical protein
MNFSPGIIVSNVTVQEIKIKTNGIRPLSNYGQSAHDETLDIIIIERLIAAWNRLNASVHYVGRPVISISVITRNPNGV